MRRSGRAAGPGGGDPALELEGERPHDSALLETRGRSGGVLETLDANRIVVATPSEPVPRRPHPRISTRPVRAVGEVRLPIAGPYCPRARLYRYPDGRLLWLVRLWEVDRAVPHLVSTDVLRTFARVNGLAGLRAEVDALVERARELLDR